MHRFLLTFCAGALILGLPWPADASLPAWLGAGGLAGALALLVAGGLMGGRGTSGAWLAWAGLPLGLAWSGFALDRALEARVEDGGAGMTSAFTGEVVSEPVRIDTPGPSAQRFQVRVLSAEAEQVALTGRTLRLSWYGGQAVRYGERWRWTAVVKGPWSYASPGGFDYERWLLGADIQGTGYVRAGERARKASPGVIERARAAVAALVHGLDLPYGGVLLALLVGQSDGISDAVWGTLRDTGTVHLMVVSGLHVSLAAALGFGIGRLAGRLCPLLPLWIDARMTGCAAGGAVAAVYVLLAGAGLPALRALVMSAATLALLAGARTGRLGAALLLALAIVLLVDPLSIHQQGLWLSFGAVAILYLALGHRHGAGRLRALLRAQLALSVAMLPLVAATTGTLPWTGVAANLLAVPVMSLVTVPAVLLGGALTAVSTSAAGWVFAAADVVVAGVLWWLRCLALAPLPAGGGWSLALAQAAAVCWLLDVPARFLPGLALCALLPLVTFGSGIAHGTFRVMALDVGQGTAVVIDTRRRRLLYDAGPGFPSGFETGSTVVVPSVAATGVARLDMLILSHDDLDHVGGAEAVTAALAPKVVIAPPAAVAGPSGRGAPPARCTARRWRWDGVLFRLLAVRRPTNASDNDRSCILLVDDGKRRMLIAGDVGARVEADLLRLLAPASVPVHLMFAPHHGSRTSSSTALVRVLRPRLVMVSAGRGNRFGHPHPEVVQRYRRVGARLAQTGREGALVWRSDSPAALVRWRSDRAPYWRVGVGGDAEDVGGDAEDAGGDAEDAAAEGSRVDSGG